MSFALIGVVAMQLYFLKQSYDMQSKIFDRSVNEALDVVVNKLSLQDADNFLNRKARYRNALKSQVYKANSVSEAAYKNDPEEKRILIDDSAKKLKLKKHQTLREKQLALLRDSLRRMINHQRMDDALGSVNVQVRIEQFTDEFGEVHLRYIPILTNNVINSKHKLQKYDTLRYYYQDPQFGNQVMSQIRINPLWVADQKRRQKERQMQQVKQLLMADSIQNLQAGKPTVMNSLFQEYQKSGEPLRKRLDPFWVDSLLRFELHNKGIYLPFSYEVTSANSDSVIYSKAMDLKGDRPTFTQEASYQTPIFTKEVINDPGKIRLAFPQKNSLILGRMGAAMGITGALLLVLIFCFGYTLFSIIRQKKISEMKTDFINNMTHEFKTPVSTIMIASEALKDSEVAIDRGRIARLANIIYEENERLGSHIERVLNIARIDKNDFKLDRKPLDVNEMISVVVDSMALKLQKCNANLTLDLEAENAVISADELHFSNVLYNLIDNAIKYSENQPQITISSSNKNGHVIIKVADKGIGMSRDQQSKIFEQFYRIPTGNVHNVKGFGLGLSYVNTVVKRLNGTINVRSEKDRGSEFELKFQGA
ncbi:HAMP domain-containing histidine kinase [Mucilaginibacter corticis]|uniref:histidine kinase n=1 Tax=Mucilaginibacter corticis TaxID=2597670 RepID=A0A556MTE3_9SPHI|nr:HAMP domain-containing sensor histidine kinase [Mucilaginibacter corticis]TSJ43147.1 HAMP domain-containing histidine kinase [Mucilaginibacter corticis]